MQNGQMGVIIIIASLMFSIGGGFLLNTTDVTACETEFTYVTDVAGAFTGTQGNIEIEHNPAENISGYSVYNPDSTEFRSNTVPGIAYQTTNPNVYWIQKSTGDPVTQALTISHNRSPNNANPGTVTYNFGSGTSPTSTISGEWAINNSEIRTILFVAGDTHTRVAGVTVYDLVHAYMTWKGVTSLDTNAMRIYFNSSTDGYPGFITNQSFSIYDTTESGSRIIYTEVRYSSIQNDILVNPTNGSVRINNQSYGWKDVYAVWGESNSTSASMTLILGGQVVTEYVDPVYGVKPISVTVDDPTQQGETANAIHVGGLFVVPSQGERTFLATISYRTVENGAYSGLFPITIQHFSNGFYAVGYDNHDLFTGTQAGDLYVYWDWNSDNPTVISVWLHNSTMPASPSTIPISDIPSDGIYQLTITYNSYGTNISNISTTIYNKSTTPVTSTTQTGGSTLQCVTTYTLPLQITYTTTYWDNKVDNSKVVMAIKKPTQDTDNVMFVNYGIDGGFNVSEPMRLKYEDSAWYFYDSDNNPVNLGDWAGMLLTIKIENKQHYYVLTPIQTFTDFQNVVIINREYTYTSSTVASVDNPNYQSIRYIQFNNTDQPYPYHEVISTTILLVDGGLYLNNGWFSPAISFPSDDIIQFKLMSAVRTGESVTITVDQSGYEHDGDPIEIDGSFTYTIQSVMYGYLPGGEWAVDDTTIPGLTFSTHVLGGTPILSFSGRATTDGVYYLHAMQYNYPDPTTEVTLQFIVTGAENPSPYSTTYQVNSMGTGLIIDGRSYVFSDISLYYVSEDVPTITIEGDLYTGGLYLGGQFLSKGHLYLIYGKNQNVIDLGTTTNAWSIQLNGLWAMSTAYYVGENKATSVVVWDEPGVWHWDANLTLITFIAVNIIGMVVCTKFGEMSIWDWVIPICACVVAFVLVG